MDGRLAMRRAKRERLEAIWQAVEREPGIRPGRVARRLCIPRSSVTRALPALEADGLLLSEDGRGRLWTWERQKR
jgi:Mn-dependent DtxR family transcriptional regulator